MTDCLPIEPNNIDKDNALPLYLQIYQTLRQKILRGELAAGCRLPAGRRLAQTLGVARVTIAEAYGVLQSEGYIVRRQGSGTYVADALPIAPQSDILPPDNTTATLSTWGNRVMQLPGKTERPSFPRPPIDFGFGRSFSHIFPYDIWRKLLARYLSTDDVMLSRYGSGAGYFPLRQALANYLGKLRGVVCLPEQVVIVSGAQQALDILARLLMEPGDELLTETPGYVDARAIFQAYGAQIHSLPVDDHGFPVEIIPTGSRARLLFVTPSNQFPQGGALPLERRLAMLQWAQAHQAWIVEDDYDGELRYDGRPLSALQGLDENGRVIYLGTFSKVLFPALRMGYVVLPRPLVAPFIQAKSLVDRGAPTLTQAAIADFINEGYFERHLRRLRKVYGKRHQILVQALRTYLPDGIAFSPTPAGLHIMVYLPHNYSEGDLVHRAAAAGVGIYPGAIFHHTQPAPPSILLGFSGISGAEINKGVQKLGALM